MNENQILDKMFATAKNELPLTTFEQIQTSCISAISSGTPLLATKLLTYIATSIAAVCTGFLILFGIPTLQNAPTPLPPSNAGTIYPIQEQAVEDDTKSLTMATEKNLDDVYILEDAKPAPRNKELLRLDPLNQHPSLNGHKLQSGRKFQPRTLPLSSIPKQPSLPLAASDPDTLKTFTIPRTGGRDQFSQLIQALQAAGIQADNKTKTVNEKELSMIKLKLKHPDGLNFKMKSTGFQKMTFRLIYDEDGTFKYFTYQVNDQEKYNRVSLKTKGYKTYLYYDTDERM
ncbi:MAG: hypothetical protein AAF242_11095 [Bacteroidota bacterium]